MTIPPITYSPGWSLTALVFVLYDQLWPIRYRGNIRENTPKYLSPPPLWWKRRFKRSLRIVLIKLGKYWNLILPPKRGQWYMTSFPPFNSQDPFGSNISWLSGNTGKYWEMLGSLRGTSIALKRMFWIICCYSFLIKMPISVGVQRFTSKYDRRHLLSLVVTRSHLSSLVVICRHLSSFVVTCRHLSSLVVICRSPVWGGALL